MSFRARASVFSARIVDGQTRLDDRPLTPNHSVVGDPRAQGDCRLAVTGSLVERMTGCDKSGRDAFLR